MPKETARLLEAWREAADRVAGGAKKAFHDREAELVEAEGKHRDKGVPGGLGEPT